MKIYLQESVRESELGLIGFRSGEMKYICLYDRVLNVHGVVGYVDLASFHDIRIIETKRGLGDYVLEIIINKIFPDWFSFDREVNINDYLLKNIKKIYERVDIEKQMISKDSEWYREYGNNKKEFYVNHLFKLTSPTLDIKKLKEIGNNILNYNLESNKYRERIDIIKHLYDQALEGKIRN